MSFWSFTQKLLSYAYFYRQIGIDLLSQLAFFFLTVNGRKKCVDTAAEFAASAAIAAAAFAAARRRGRKFLTTAAG